MRPHVLPSLGSVDHTGSGTALVSICRPQSALARRLAPRITPSARTTIAIARTSCPRASPGGAWRLSDRQHHLERTLTENVESATGGHEHHAAHHCGFDAIA